MTKQMNYIFSLTAILLMCGGVTVSRAQTANDPSLSIGYINPQAVLQKMPEYQAVRQRMQNYIQEKQQNLRQQAQSFQNELTDFQKHKSVMSTQAKKNEQKRLSQLRANLQQARRQAQRDIQKKRQSLINPLRAKIQNAIQTVAANMGLSYVVSAATILYASDSAKKNFNITQKVEEQLNI